MYDVIDHRSYSGHRDDTIKLAYNEFYHIHAKCKILYTIFIVLNPDAVVSCSWWVCVRILSHLRHLPVYGPWVRFVKGRRGTLAGSLAYSLIAYWYNVFMSKLIRLCMIFVFNKYSNAIRNLNRFSFMVLFFFLYYYYYAIDFSAVNL